MRYLFQIVFTLVLFSTLSYAEYVLEEKNQNIELLGLSYFEDKEGTLSLEEVQKQDFLVHDDNVMGFGFTSSVYWIKFSTSLQDKSSLEQWWLNVSYPLLNKLDLYICDENDKLLELKKSGKARPFKDREVKDRNFLFQINSAAKQNLYLRVQTQSSMQIPLSIQSTQNLFETSQMALILSGIYYGLFILIFIYNFISFVYTRSRKYFLYLLFISSFALWQLSLDGLGIQFFWSEWNWMIDQGGGVMMGVLTLSIILFSREFLQTKFHAPRIDIALKVGVFIMSWVSLMATFRPYSEIIPFTASGAVVLPPLLLAVGIIAYKQKFYPARFYIMGWSFFLLGSGVFALNKFAVIEGYAFLSYAQQVGSVLEMIFLSWALADFQKQSEREYLNKINGLNSLLQEKVNESLLQIRHNDQVMIEKSRLAAMGEMIEQIAHQWRQPLQTLSLLNQDYFFKTMLKTNEDGYEKTHDRINEQLQYMSQTIDDFRNFSHANKEKEVFNLSDVIESSLNLSEGSLKYSNIKTNIINKGEQLIFGMRHEMMQVCMNLIKNVHDIVVEKKMDSAWINFTIEDKEDNYHISVEDNAGGIPMDKIANVFDPYFSTKTALGGSGIGLYMSKEIIQKSFLGSISVQNADQGALFTLILAKSKNGVSSD